MANAAGALARFFTQDSQLSRAGKVLLSSAYFACFRAEFTLNAGGIYGTLLDMKTTATDYLMRDGSRTSTCWKSCPCLPRACITLDRDGVLLEHDDLFLLSDRRRYC
jgi:hypothetical protein